MDADKVDDIPALLKAFVIGAGVILVVGMLILTGVLVLRATGRDGEGPPDLAVSEAPVELALPAGARVEQVIPDGRHVLLLGVDGEGSQFLAVVDPESGRRLQLIRFRAGP